MILSGDTRPRESKGLELQTINTLASTTGHENKYLKGGAPICLPDGIRWDKV